MVRRWHFCVGHAQVARWSRLRLIGKPAGLYLADADPVFHRTLPMSSAYSGSVSRRVQFYLQVGSAAAGDDVGVSRRLANELRGNVECRGWAGGRWRD